MAEEGAQEYRFITLTRRLKMLGVVDTMTDQMPEVVEAMEHMQAKLNERLSVPESEGWRALSHGQSIYNGILIISVLLARPRPPEVE
jgi:hypothetical protein